MHSSPEQEAHYHRAKDLAARMVGTNELQLMLVDTQKIEARHSQPGHVCERTKTMDTGSGMDTTCDLATLAHYVGVLAWALGARPG